MGKWHGSEKSEEQVSKRQVPVRQQHPAISSFSICKLLSQWSVQDRSSYTEVALISVTRAAGTRHASGPKPANTGWPDSCSGSKDFGTC